METRWYVEPGKEVRSVKVADRKLALHATASAWKKVTGHLDRKRLEQQSTDREVQHKRMIKERSKAMVETWDNSIENARKRKDRERGSRLKKKADDRMMKFFEMRAEQELRREKYVADIRDKSYAKEHYPSEINSAYITAQIAWERTKQIEFHKTIKNKEYEDEQKEVQKLRRAVEDEQKENAEKARNEHQKKIEMKEHYLNEIRAHELVEKEAKKQILKIEAEDLEMEQREVQKLTEIRERELEERQKKFTKDIEKQLICKERKKTWEENFDREYQQIIAVQTAAKDRLDRMKQEKKMEFLKAVMKQNRKSAQGILEKLKERTEQEEELLKKQTAELERLFLEKLKVKAEYTKMLRQERIEDRQKFLRQKEAYEKHEEEVRKWEIINRYKRDDHRQEFELEKLQEKFNATLDYRKELIEQMDEVKERKKAEMNEKRQLLAEQIQKGKEEDKKFFDYAEKALNEAKTNGYSTIPIEHVINKYKKSTLLIEPSLTRENCIDIKAPN